MCGIAGFYNVKAHYLPQSDYYYDLLTQMGESIRHRGPDDSGVILNDHCGLSHRRLSIIDLENGTQPMTKEREQFGYHIVYNGEIYNMDVLRSKLLAQSVQIHTHSDTELLLLSFLTFGPSFVTDLDGIFSFAIYDERHAILTLFRDPFGVKPLYYTQVKDTFVFCSEIKGLLCFPGVQAVLDCEGFNELFGLGPAHTPGKCILKNIHEVLPGSYMTISENGIAQFPYYRLHSMLHTDSYEDTLEHTRFLVTDAIRRQMVSDVPVCTFLSGGVDSSLVSAVCAEELRKKNQRLKTFSFDFIGNDTYFQANAFQPSQDRPFVDKMVEYLHSNHSYLECNSNTQVDYLYRSVNAHDLPCMADIDSSLLYFCEQVSHSHKVVLTGECADEVFGGYPWFHKPEFLNSNTFPWTPSLEPRQNLLRNDLLKKSHMDEYVAATYRNALQEIDILPFENETETNRRRIGYLNIRFFMQTLLTRMDRTSMANGLEARVPFASKALVDYVFNVPWSMKCKDGSVKHLLRESCRGLLPDEILFRKKSPYPKTYNPSYEQLLVTNLRSILEKNTILTELCDRSALTQFLDSPKDYGSPWYGQLMAGPQMIAYLIQVDYFFRKYHVQLDM